MSDSKRRGGSHLLSENCVMKHEHAADEPGPFASYQAWHEWAEEKGKTHNQFRCLGCGLYVVWSPKGANPKPAMEATLRALDDREADGGR